MAQRHSNQQQTTQEQSNVKTYLPINENSEVAFSDGVMTVRGQPQRPVRVEHWESSNGMTTYTTVEWQDPQTQEHRTSCNCPGWANKRSGSDRSCCHTKDMQNEKACTRRKVESLAITSVQQAMAEIPDIREGRQLRGIMLD